MTEIQKSEAFAEMVPSAPSPGALTAGQLLRAARLKAGVHLAVLSVTLKVPVKQLEALEADQFDPAKGAVFLRGLASAVCRHLRADPAPILALLPLVPGQLEPQRMLGKGVTTGQGMGGTRASLSKPRPMVVGGAVAMLALIAALLWLPAPAQWLWLDDLKDWLVSASQSDDESSTEPVNPVPPSVNDGEFPGTRHVVESVAAATAVSPVAQASAEPAATAAPTAVANTASAPLAPVLNAAAKTSPPPALPAASNAPASAAKPTSAEWVFSASSDSWIELRSGANTVVWSGILKAGQTQQIQSPLPVNVVVGRAQGVSVTLRGQAFDLKPHTQVTVARFEVKE